MTQTVDTAAAEALREELESDLGQAMEAVGEAITTAGKLKAAFADSPDYADEYKEASSWQSKLLFMPLAEVLAQVAGEEESKDEDAPMQLMLERKKVAWLERLVRFARTIESSEFDVADCDEVQTDLESALA